MFFWRKVYMTPRLHISPVLVRPEDYSWFEMHRDHRRADGDARWAEGATSAIWGAPAGGWRP
jgi:hypothetical protein